MPRGEKQVLKLRNRTVSQEQKTSQAAKKIKARGKKLIQRNHRLIEPRVKIKRSNEKNPIRISAESSLSGWRNTKKLKKKNSTHLLLTRNNHPHEHHLKVTGRGKPIICRKHTHQRKVIDPVRHRGERTELMRIGTG